MICLGFSYSNREVLLVQRNLAIVPSTRSCRWDDDVDKMEGGGEAEAGVMPEVALKSLEFKHFPSFTSSIACVRRISASSIH